MNPDLVLLVYLNGGFSMNDDGTRYPNRWYAHDIYGRKVKSVEFTNYLMDVSNQNWVNEVADNCTSSRARTAATTGACWIPSARRR